MLTAWRDTVPAALFAAGTRIAREVPAVLIPEGIGFVGAIFVGSMIQQDMVPERFESHIRLAPVIFLGEPIPADSPSARLPEALTRTQPEPFTVSITFIKRLAGNWQVACRIWRRGSHSGRAAGPLLPRLKFELTTRA